tara:strand:+ start:511 stop:747 length:237 start_codon:yes stop_codon:yes gene_type:complete
VSPCEKNEYRKSATGRPKLPDEERKTFKGTIRFDAALDKALKEEMASREKSGAPADQATIMRSLIIKGLKDLGHDISE